MTSYHLAPEWARQDAVILVWPHQHSDWAQAKNDTKLDRIEKTYIELTRYISRNQKVVLNAYDQTHIAYIQTCLSKSDSKFENIIFTAIPTNDTWVRDYGPICVRSNSEDVLLNFKFDAWGNKYTHEKDNAFNQVLRKELALEATLLQVKSILEAGNIDVNDKACLLSSKSCFKRSQSNQSTEILLIENNFRSWFGSEHIFWIDKVKLIGDDTDGHIDTLARYCSDNIIAYSAVGHASDPNKNNLTTLNQQLIEIKTSCANDLELIPIPLPKPIFDQNKQLPASYVNFLITNKYVFVPVFNDKQDESALKIIDDCFPSREIIDIESNALIQEYGGIHCATMQIPQGFLS